MVSVLQVHGDQCEQEFSPHIQSVQSLCLRVGSPTLIGNVPGIGMTLTAL